MSRYFIDRPVFAWVLAILVMLGGALAIRSLPVAQYPSIAPPQIGITATYPGASAETVQNTVVQVIEQQMTGLDGLIYFSSQSSKDGSATITLSFAQGTNPDTAQVQVQNKLQLAMPRLPLAVQQQGIRVAKATINFVMVLGFVSADGSMDSTALADYVATSLQDPLSRTRGVGDVQLFGSPRAMRIWLDPAKLLDFGLTTAEVTAAIAAQNVQIAAGELGARPQEQGQQLNATIIGPTLLQTPEQFGAVLLKVSPSGAQVRLRDVARIEMGSESYATFGRFNNAPAAGMAIRLAAGANALDTAANVRATIAGLRTSFPPGFEVVEPYDTTPFIRISISEVVQTLFEAILLVFLVMYLFLQNLRATLIPTLAVPVVLLGTFAVLWAAGYSINALTMFAMVLAIGLLVDDAIVVVENVEQVMAREGLPPREATRRSMDEISGALVGIALVLSAVFLPMAFLGGSTGVIYRQFAVTIASAMLLSVLTALVFTPALCATILKPGGHGHGGPLGWFNRGLERSTGAYVRGVRRFVDRPLRWLLVFGVIVGGTFALFARLPGAFLPDEDQGIMFVQVMAPAGATSVRTDAALAEVTRWLLEEERETVASVLTVSGFNFGGRGQNSGIAFVRLRDWHDRARPELKVRALAGRFMRRFGGYRDALIFAFAPPPIVELGNASGFDMQLLDRGGLGHEALMAARNQLLGMASQSPLIGSIRPNGQDDEPQYRLVIDWERASALGLTVPAINTTLAAALGATYVNDFLDRGRIKRVYVQGDAAARMQPADLEKWYVRNTVGQMVPFAAFASAVWGTGSPRLERYNGVPSVELLGTAAPGQSTGIAMAEMERLASRLPDGIGFDWTGLSYEERLAGSQTTLLYLVSVLFVFLCLAALYESWAVPAAVMLAVPLGVAGAVVAVWMRGFANDVYFQVALLTTIGLAAKNAILIVEFAKMKFDAGQSLAEAAADAARQRLRPILMTSLAFVLGVLPLAISTGAGSGGQNAIGTGVIGGMVAGTVLTIFFVPMFFVTVLRLFRTRQAGAGRPVAAPAPGE